MVNGLPGVLGLAGVNCPFFCGPGPCIEPERLCSIFVAVQPSLKVAFMKKSFGLMVNVVLILRLYCGSSSAKLKYCSSIAVTRTASCHANGRPIQPLAPLPKGFHEFGGSLLKLLQAVSTILGQASPRSLRSTRDVPYSSSIRSGFHSSASSPYIAGSRWT